MTRISEIHGIKQIPADEYADRGEQVQKPGYVPFLSLTKGEMELLLLAQRAKILAQFYGNDAPQYKQAATLLDNALHAGIHSGGAISVGAIPDALQWVAKTIQKAKTETAPASGGLFYRPKAMAGIGQIIPAAQRQAACLDAAGLDPFKRARCKKAFQIETIINGYLEPAAPHMLYKSIATDFTVPTEVAIKRQGHKLGVQGLAQVGGLSSVLMDSWVENGILARNASGGVGAAGSIKSSFYLSKDPEKEFADYLATHPAASKWYGINGPHIGIAPAIVVALTGLLLAAIGAATKLLTDLQKVDFKALVETRGFGTSAYSADQADWVLGGKNQQTNTQMNEILMLALLAGGVFLLNEEN